jgi:hypothetical protein
VKNWVAERDKCIVIEVAVIKILLKTSVPGSKDVDLSRKTEKEYRIKENFQ